MTHHHHDQAQGLHRAAKAGARIWVPETEQDLFSNVDAHWQARSIANTYNVRQDRFSLLAPVPVGGLLRDYEVLLFGGLAIEVIPTPGHTPAGAGRSASKMFRVRQPSFYGSRTTARRATPVSST
jgi:glyoxylase-like metal-dependent hydrolase (beta-lactamase superfamily II)